MITLITVPHEIYVKKTNQQEVKDVGLGHVAASGQDQDREPVPDKAGYADGQDGHAFQPEAADGDDGLVCLAPGAAGCILAAQI